MHDRKPLGRPVLKLVFHTFDDDGIRSAFLYTLSQLNCWNDGQGTNTCLVERGDKQAFIDSFRKVEHWFGDYAQRFQSESRTLLRQANDNRQ